MTRGNAFVWTSEQARLIVCDAQGVRAAERALGGESPAESPAEALRALGAELGLKPGRVVHVGVPRAEVLLKEVVVPDVPPEEREALVRFQAAKVLPFELSEVALAWGVLGQGAGGGIRVRFAAVRREVCARVRGVVEEAGYAAGHVEVAVLAAARALEGAAEPTLLVVAEPGGTEVAVWSGGEVTASRGSAVSWGEDAAGVQAWAQDVTRSWLNAQATGGAPGGSPAEVVVLGAGADDPVRVQALGQALLAPARAGAPGEVGPRFGVAWGLACPVAGALDLAHHTKAQQRTQARRRGTAGAAAALVLGLVGVGTVEVWLSDQAGRVAAMEEERAALEPAVERAESLQDELDEAAGWSSRRGRELEVLLAISEALPEGEVYLTRLTWVDGKAVRLSGRAKEWGAVGAFLAALERHPRIERADFDQIRQPRSEGTLGLDFSGTAELVSSKEGS